METCKTGTVIVKAKHYFNGMVICLLLCKALGGLVAYSRHTVDDSKLSSPDLSKIILPTSSPQISASSASPSRNANANAFAVTNAAQRWKKSKSGQHKNVIHEENAKDDDDYL